MQIVKTNCNFEREPLKAPFGFKGGYLSELWQTSAYMQSQSGNEGVGLGTQSTLWSDAEVFAYNSESAGNSMMFLLTSYALEIANKIKWDTPFDLLEKILPDVYEYGRTITNNPNLRLTFALNSLVAVDNELESYLGQKIEQAMPAFRAKEQIKCPPSVQRLTNSLYTARWLIPSPSLFDIENDLK